MKEETKEIKRNIIIPFLEWLVKKDISISESAEGFIYRSCQIGAKKYTPEDIFNWHVSENLV